MKRFTVDRFRKNETFRRFKSLNRRKRLLKRLRLLHDREPELTKNLSLFLNIDEVLMMNNNIGMVNSGKNDYVYQDPNLRKLRDIINIEESELINNGFSLNEEEMKVKENYNLSFYDIEQYRELARNIFYDDYRILKLLGIDSGSFNDEVYKKILYYIAELCKNGREIRADFFN